MTQMTKKEFKFRKRKKGMIKTIKEQLYNINYWSHENHKLLLSILEELRKEDNQLSEHDRKVMREMIPKADEILYDDPKEEEEVEDR